MRNGSITTKTLRRIDFSFFKRIRCMMIALDDAGLVEREYWETKEKEGSLK